MFRLSSSVGRSTYKKDYDDQISWVQGIYIFVYEMIKKYLIVFSLEGANDLGSPLLVTTILWSKEKFPRSTLDVKCSDQVLVRYGRVPVELW